MKIPYRFIKNDSKLSLDPIASKVVRHIVSLYLSGQSLGGIADILEKAGVLSPSGNTRWSRSVIDVMLSNPVYVLAVIPEEIRLEKEKRSNQNENTSRKTTKYHSKIVPSGLSFCAECGAVYRRIARPDKEVVWRCANRVEHGNSLALTKKFRDFKCAGVEGIEACQIRSIILPLLADHVLREANHYIRLLEA